MSRVPRPRLPTDGDSVAEIFANGARYVKSLWDASASRRVEVESVTLVGLGTARATFVTAHSAQPTVLFLSGGGYAELVSKMSEFENFYDPVTRLELVNAGLVGVLLGLEVLTDGFFDASERFIGSRNWLA